MKKTSQSEIAAITWIEIVDLHRDMLRQDCAVHKKSSRGNANIEGSYDSISAQNSHF